MLGRKLFIYLCLVYILSCQVASQILETDYFCTGSEIQLECPENKNIVIMSTFGRYSPSQCVNQESVDFLSHGNPPLDHCIGINRNDEILNSVCNGLTSCKAIIQPKKHQNGYDGTTCDFESNMQKVSYACVPKKIEPDLKSFDVCGPDIIANIDRGFIHSPSYPEYYGNRKHCVVSLTVPIGHNINIFVLTKSMEGPSVLSLRPRDYFVIEDEIEHQGFASQPYLAYSGADRKKIKIKFKSDIFTLASLQSPKGFLLYFEIIAPPTTTTSTTTTISTSTSTTTYIPELTSVFSKLAHDDLFSQKMKKEIDTHEDGEYVTPIAILVGIVGVLIVVIFGLLFVFRRKQQKRKRAQEEIVYDEKSISSGTNYNEEYQNVSIVSNQQLNKDTMNLSAVNKMNSRSEPANTGTGFNTRLKAFYSNINKTLHLSSQAILTPKEKADEKMNEYENDKNIKSEKLNLKDNKQISMYNVNEFNPNDINVKYEKDILIDRLKLFKTSSRSLKSVPNVYKKSNIELEREQKDAINRLENTYVSNPVVLDSKHEEIVEDNGDSLNIYEVNFENNFAYLKPSLSKSSSSISSNKTNNEESAKLTKRPILEEDGTNIYQTIDDIDSQQEAKSISYSNLKKSSLDETSLNDTSLTDDPTRAILKRTFDRENIDNIYSTPSNKQVVKTVSSSSSHASNAQNQDEKNDDDKLNQSNQNSSVIHLLNDNENDETNA